MNLLSSCAADAKEMNRARPFVSPDGGSFIKVCNAYRAELLLEKRVSKVRAPQLVILLDEKLLSVDNSVGTLYRDTCNSVLKYAVLMHCGAVCSRAGLVL